VPNENLLVSFSLTEITVQFHASFQSFQQNREREGERESIVKEGEGGGEEKKKNCARKKPNSMEYHLGFSMENVAQQR